MPSPSSADVHLSDRARKLARTRDPGNERRAISGAVSELWWSISGSLTKFAAIRRKRPNWGGSGWTIKPPLGRVDGFDQDKAESKRDERAIILRRLLASKCDTLEALELADRLFDACPRLVKCFWKEGGHVFGVGSIRDCRTYSALACGFAV